jgi:hypothetical protein
VKSAVNYLEMIEQFELFRRIVKNGSIYNYIIINFVEELMR